LYYQPDEGHKADNRNMKN